MNWKINIKIEFIYFLVILLTGITYAREIKSKVKPGVDVLLEEKTEILEGKKVGLITNPTGVTSNLRSTIDVFHENPNINLAALFGPEHGVRGNVDAGEKIEDFTDEKTGVPVYSLYGDTRKPTSDMMEDVEVLVYDIQDNGCRSYTYIYTMAYGMQAAAEKGIPFVVLDRPNPLGGELVEGPILDPEYKSFVGMYPIPYIYGLTSGELAKYFNKEFEINSDLKVVPMKGWERDMQFEDTGLEWVPTSPHLPSSKTALYYPATGIIGELRTVNIGIGYTNPFELIGQKWIKPNELANRLNKFDLPGIYFRPTYYTPFYADHKDENLKGVHLHILDNERFKPVKTQIYILATLKELYPEEKIFNEKRNEMFDKVIGNDKVRRQIKNGVAPEKIVQQWQEEVERFRENRKKYFIYK